MDYRKQSPEFDPAQLISKLVQFTRKTNIKSTFVVATVTID